MPMSIKPQDAQKGQPSHSPNPSAPRRAFSQARPQQVTKDGSSKLACLPCPLMARMSPPLRASNEGFLKPRVARAPGTHRAIPPSAGGLFQHPANAEGQAPRISADRLRHMRLPLVSVPANVRCARLTLRLVQPREQVMYLPEIEEAKEPEDSN